MPERLNGMVVIRQAGGMEGDQYSMWDLEAVCDDLVVYETLGYSVGFTTVYLSSSEECHKTKCF